MALEVGSRLGHYDVTALIGEGGMGQVYRATDTQLGRDVALKILPDAFASDPDRLARFQREAQVLASLNHPGIAAIYGLEQSHDTQALVLELVEGPTLADRIAKGPIPLDEALPIAKQIAEALEAAHEAGVIHRDLKPANIKVREDGTVKVLDFGLAKALDTTPEGDPSQSPTLTAAATQMGVILGTAAYMSPEQASGKAVDRRADVWAFGVVLYEMLTGGRPFDGVDVSKTLAHVIAIDPDLSVLPKTVPPVLSTFLRGCLAKNPKQRVQAIGDVRLAMEGAFDTAASTASAPTAAPPLRLWRRPIPAIAALGLVITTALAVWSASRPTAAPAESIRRFALDIGPVSPIPIVAVGAMLAWSPDGTRLVYAANVAGTHQLYLRTLDDLEAHPIAGTENAYDPFFSPDGEWVGFSVVVGPGDGELKRIAVGGGAPLTLCECFSFQGATWLADGTIVGTPRIERSAPTLHRIPEGGGTPDPLTTLDAESGDRAHIWPHALPGGTHVLFTILPGRATDGAIPDADTGRVAVLSLDTGEHHVVVEGGYNARYVPTGHLVFGRQGAVWGVPFDLDRLATTGPEELLLQAIEVNERTGTMALSVSGDGTLVYRPGGAVSGALAEGGGTPVWVDRTGRATPIGVRRSGVQFPRLSPDDTRLAMAVTSGQGQDIWVEDLDRGSSTRLTDDGTALNPAWSPDGDRVFFTSASLSSFGLHSRAADASDERQAFLTGDRGTGMAPFSWTPDGQALFFWEGTLRGGDIWTVSPDGDRSPYLVGANDFTTPDLSPDGQWLAYASDESGQLEISVHRYPDQGGKVTVSSGGGREPRWSPAGRELFYRSLAGDRMMVVAVTTDPTFSLSRPEVLFEFDNARIAGRARNYDVSSDGQRFVMISGMLDAEAESGPADTTLILVENWFEELNRLVPTN